MKSSYKCIWFVSIFFIFGFNPCIFAEDYPLPKPPRDLSQYGRHFQHSMTLLTTSTPGLGWSAIKKISWNEPLLIETWQVVCRGFNEKQDEFTFTIRGSKTGPDGGGNAKQKFVSNSCRIVIESEDRVFEYDKRVRKKAAPDGYKVTWKVELMGTDEYIAPQVDNASREYASVLASNLSKGRHTLVLTSAGNNKPDIRAIRVYTPPFGDN